MVLAGARRFETVRPCRGPSSRPIRLRSSAFIRGSIAFAALF